MTDRKTTAGYAVTIVATKSVTRSLFFPCDLDDPASLYEAAAKIEAEKAALAAEGYTVKAKQRLRLRADPAQLAMPQTATEEVADAAQAGALADEANMGAAEPEHLDVPAAMRRKPA